jgi:lipopolysaccharide/colanic/teichoic acid biosynthesis glycosyltransferase/glycosyltransferase involved in cell wall biosynthesis
LISESLTEHNFLPRSEKELFQGLESFRREGTYNEWMFYPRYVSSWCMSKRKRTFDLVLSLLALAVCAPLMLLIAFLIQLTSEGPALFRQERVGLHQRTFIILKFRTMEHHLDGFNEGPSVTRHCDSRITKVGAWLRRLKLDELPQLINVARGEMSFVGPRPKLALHENLCMLCRPGITGAATIEFSREEDLLMGIPEKLVERYVVTVLNPEKCKLDIRYIETARFTTDLGILMRTICKLSNKSTTALSAKSAPFLMATPSIESNSVTAIDYQTSAFGEIGNLSGSGEPALSGSVRNECVSCVGAAILDDRTFLESFPLNSSSANRGPEPGARPPCSAPVKQTKSTAIMQRKRLLVLTSRFPYPIVGGDRLRIYRICKALSQQFDLTLLSLCDTKEELGYTTEDGVFKEIHRVYLPKWESYLNTLFGLLSQVPLQLAYYRSLEFRNKVDELLPTHDIALAHLIRTGQYLEDHNEKPRILEMTDAISLNYRRMQGKTISFSFKKIIYYLEHKKLFDYELKAIRKFHRTWLVSDVDRIALDPDHTSPVEVIPNGTDPQNLPFHPPIGGGDTIVFIGNMLSAQNQDACLYFIRSILPLIQKQKHLKFRIVGNIAEKTRKQFLAYADVQTTGRLTDIVDGIDSSVFCGVCPVQAGAGIQNKILEYFALGLPCVTSQVGAEGIDADPGKDLLIYRNAEQAAQQILHLHSNRALRMSLATSARSLVENKLAWRFLDEQINKSVEEVCTAPIRLISSEVSEKRAPARQLANPV